MQLSGGTSGFVMRANIEDSSFRQPGGGGQLCPQFSMPPGIAELATPARQLLHRTGLRVNRQFRQHSWSQRFANHNDRSCPEWYAALSLTDIMQESSGKYILVQATTCLQTSANTQTVPLIGRRH